MFSSLRSDSTALSHMWLGLPGGRFQVRSKSVMVSYTLRTWPNTLLKDEESARDNHVLVEGEGMEGMGRKGLEIGRGGRGGKDVKGRKEGEGLWTSALQNFSEALPCPS